MRCRRRSRRLRPGAARLVRLGRALLREPEELLLGELLQLLLEEGVLGLRRLGLRLRESRLRLKRLELAHAPRLFAQLQLELLDGRRELHRVELVAERAHLLLQRDRLEVDELPSQPIDAVGLRRRLAPGAVGRHPLQHLEALDRLVEQVDLLLVLLELPAQRRARLLLLVQHCLRRKRGHLCQLALLAQLLHVVG